MATQHPGGEDTHPFLRGNFAPVDTEYISDPCEVVFGKVPQEFLGGQYVRNGGNPVYPPQKGRHYHWFDGDGMLHGVYFTTNPEDPPLYTNRHLATPLLTMSLLLLRSPIPSIALLISPLSSLHRILAAIIQAFFIALRARLGVLSVANTSVIWWGTNNDQRLLATCESGPPLEVRVPELETVGWDRFMDQNGESLRTSKASWWKRWTLGRIQEDWMTAHPRIDPVDGSLLFYSTQMFDAPHARYSVIDGQGRHVVWKEGVDIGRSKMMHDFAATRTHTILLNLPLTLAPANLFSMPPVPLIHFDRTLPSEFVVFPRYLRSVQTPQEPIRFVEPEPCLIFHTANAWDEVTEDGLAINMLACRFKSAKLVYAAGAVDIPIAERADDVVMLHYYRFELPQAYLDIKDAPRYGKITHSFPLMAIPFEFPIMPMHLGMSPSRYIYGCTMKSGSFDERLGGAAKVDCLVKVDVVDLIKRGSTNKEPVDGRTTAEILQQWQNGIKGPIEVFAFPDNLYAQECRFVPREGDEDDGYLVTYVYDERNLGTDGVPSISPEAGSELWIIDAKHMGDGMNSVVCRIKLPQRVPYGLHGTWIPESSLRQQRHLEIPIDQPLLQTKLERSRLQHFVSILFDRPADRHRSTPERLVLRLLWPMSVIMLILAGYEGARHMLG